ncbi:hypothetical protein [Bradyrhizobium sp. USDA 10063]
MIAIAFRRMPSKVVAELRVVSTEEGLAGRGWQDKSRNVRPVGCGQYCFDFKDTVNIAKVERTPRIWLTRRGRSAFGTLRKPR